MSNANWPLIPGLAEDLESGTEVLDVGCGSGRAVNLMAKSFPKSRFSGYDISEEAIVTARAAAEQQGLTNARFEVKDVTALDASDQYKLITAFGAMWGEEKAREMLQEAGFTRVAVKNLPHDFQNIYYLIKKS